MPSDLKCTACDLRLSVGGYHYHGNPDGYTGRTLLACRCCGAQHALEHATRDRGPETYPMLRLTVQSASAEARAILARRWLRKARNLSYSEALEAARNLPVVLYEEADAHVVEAVRRELEPLGASLVVEVVGKKPNLLHGPVQTDRLLFTPNRQFGEGREAWTVSQSAIADVAAMCCVLCGSAGALVSEVEPEEPCPSCKQGSLALLAAWIT